MAKKQEHGELECGIKHCKKNACCNPKEIVKALKKGRCHFAFIEDEYRTTEVSLEAVRLRGRNLNFVKNQTPEICIEAVLRDPRACEYVNPEWKKETAEDTIKFLMNKIESEDFESFIKTGSIQKEKP